MRLQKRTEKHFQDTVGRLLRRGDRKPIRLARRLSRGRHIILRAAMQRQFYIGSHPGQRRMETVSAFRQPENRDMGITG